MNTMPSNPPNSTIKVVGQNLNSCQAPTNKSAGIVKIAPAARLSPADAIVCTILFSRMVPRRKIPRRMAVLITAAGMEALTVIPAFNPR
ncbi:MAG: hypothetical protein BWX80_03998 [Candidatus Hydrogenedentes bacterium ADurb.Bin101]|nr:MAG: hypothetical protein BWX80_03998 [Candidatus Hydrogenedentes bacterium ADurb.Bin101]